MVQTQDSNRHPSSRSLRGLDGLNFLMADVRDGLGPYLSIYLSGSQHWAAGPVGLAMAASSLAAAFCQIPAGLLVDKLRAKRLLVALSGLSVAVGCLLIACHPEFATVIAAQILIGGASAIIPPAIAALSLGLVGRKKFDARVSRNESFNHAGNFTAAALAGTLGQALGYSYLFYLVCAFAAASAAVVNLISSGEIDHDLARGTEDGGQAIPLRDLAKRRVLWIFLVSVTLFHFGNAAMLPMAGQVLAKTHPGSDRLALSACIIAAQLVMTGMAWAVGQAMARGFGRKTIFLAAFAILPVRGLLFSFTTNPYGVVAIQLLDGVAAGIFGVIAVVIAADLMKGTGRFNLAQGLVALCTGAGAAASNAVAGFIVDAGGFSTGFLSLAGIAFGALVFFAVFMPETRDRQDSAAAPRGAPAPAAG
jgi:predicted MFS family arabinose efflux permease